MQNLENEIFNPKDDEDLKEKDIDDNYNNEINIDDVNKYTFKKDGNNNNNINHELYDIKNNELKNKIKQLEKDNDFKEYLINDLRNQIKQKNKKEKISHIKCNEYNSLLKELDGKNHRIEKLENNIKYLKLEIDNLILSNKKLMKEKEELNSKNDVIMTEVDVNKIDSLNYLQRLNDLQLESKKLNFELLKQNNELNLIKEDNSKIISKINEQNALIYNYQKNQKNLNFSQNNNSFEKKINNYTYNNKSYRNFSPNEYEFTSSSDKYSYTIDINKESEYDRNDVFDGLKKKKEYLREKRNENYFDDNDYYYGKKYNYYRNDYGDGL